MKMLINSSGSSEYLFLQVKMEKEIKEPFSFPFKNLKFGDRRIKVVIDLGNGTTSCIAEELYKMFPIDVEVLFGESDPLFFQANLLKSRLSLHLIIRLFLHQP